MASATTSNPTSLQLQYEALAQTNPFGNLLPWYQKLDQTNPLINPPSQLNYKRLVQVITVSGIFGVIPRNLKLAAGISAIALLGIEAVEKIRHGSLRALHNGYRIGSLSEKFSFENVDLDVRVQAIERAAKMVAPFKIDVLEKADDLGKDGCCHGIVSTLFYYMNQGLSIEQSEKELKPEEIYFRCIMSNFLSNIRYVQQGIVPFLEHERKRVDQQLIENTELYTRQFVKSHPKISQKELVDMLQSNADWHKEAFEGAAQKHLRPFQNYLLHKNAITELIRGIDPLPFPHTVSDPLHYTQSAETYRAVFEQAITQMHNPNSIRGSITMPKHVMGFQYGPEGYYIYDSATLEGGLFKYPNAETFFKSIRFLVEDCLKYVQKKYNLRNEHLLVRFEIL